MRTLFVAGVVVALLGCSGKKPVTGKEWAARTFGTEGSQALLRHYSSPTTAVALVELKDAPMTLPRPFAILTQAWDPNGLHGERPPEFHDLNASLPPEMAPRSATDVRALVHVERSARTKRLADIRIKRTTLKNYKAEEFLCVAVSVPQPDGSHRTVAAEAIETTDPAELLEYLKSLPAGN